MRCVSLSEGSQTANSSKNASKQVILTRQLENIEFKTGSSANEVPRSQSEASHLDGLGRIPRVRLDVDSITDMVAANLAMSLLGHVLFLKGQVPFPVMQLARVPGGQKNSRAAKLKRELLESFDTLSLHLDTTFTALSTALARCSKFRPASDSTEQGVQKPYPTSQVYMAFLVGPSTGSAKSKVFLAVDGLEVKIWGTRDDQQMARPIAGDNSDETDEGGDESESGELVEEEETKESTEEDDEEASEPEESDEDLGTEEESECSSGSSSPSPTPPKPPPRPTLVSIHSHEQEQQVTRTADRLLSRVLATADAEGNGLASDIAPTQTHILLRAPRRFNHPAWVPRQNLSTLMDSSLNEFLHEAGFSKSSVDDEKEHVLQSHLKSSSKRGQKNKIEGVWVAGKTLMQVVPEPLGGDDEGEEEDEMIWWSWNGKIVGYSPW